MIQKITRAEYLAQKPKKPSKRKNDSDLERIVQPQCVQYLDSLIKDGEKIKYTSIPNSTYTTSWSVKAKNKREGLKAGLPDLLIIINDTLIFVELKREKEGVVSSVQEAWIQALNDAGQQAFVCRGYNKFVELINKTLEFTNSS
jgi:VRR-NUC domain